MIVPAPKVTSGSEVRADAPLFQESPSAVSINPRAANRTPPRDNFRAFLSIRRGAFGRPDRLCRRGSATGWTRSPGAHERGNARVRGRNRVADVGQEIVQLQRRVLQRRDTVRARLVRLLEVGIERQKLPPRAFRRPLPWRHRVPRRTAPVKPSSAPAEPGIPRNRERLRNVVSRSPYRDD